MASELYGTVPVSGSKKTSASTPQGQLILGLTNQPALSKRAVTKGSYKTISQVNEVSQTIHKSLSCRNSLAKNDHVLAYRHQVFEKRLPSIP